MTKHQLFKWIIIASIIYLSAVVIGVTIRIYDTTENEVMYATYKDMIPFIIAIPAAWLGYCLQRRSSYLQQLRILWSTLIEAVQKANRYTYIECPTREQFSETLCSLSAAIEEVRGVFKNIGESNREIGLYPFEPVKDIYGLISDLKCDKQLTDDERNNIRTKIFALWSDVRRELLKEFDREMPTFPHSHWAQPEKSKIYESLEIPKKPT